MKNRKLDQLFNDLDELKGFCQNYGYKFDEKDLYSNSVTWVNYQNYKKGNQFLDHWHADKS